MVMTKLNKETAIEKLQKVHSGKYDYSNIEWVDRLTPLKIYCPKHGFFYQSYATHIAGRGCRTCSVVNRRVNKESWVKRCQEKHNMKYDYSETLFVDLVSYVKVKCLEHGYFEVRAKEHMISKTAICNKCREEQDNRKVTSPEWIVRFQEVHGNLYDYSLTKVIGQDHPMIIICKIHGEFKKRPINHWNGAGCKKCKEITQQGCLERFKQVHGDKFDYSKVIYVAQNKQVEVICPEHGSFMVKPASHWREDNKSGCGKCARTNRRMSEGQIIERFNKAHNYFYKYPKFKYENIHQNINIECPKHGLFSQSVNNHMRDHGCPKCWQNSASSYQKAWAKEIFKRLGIKDFKEEERVLGGRWGAVDYEYQYRGNKYILEYDGVYWHSMSGALEKDNRKTKELNKLGYTVIRLRAIDKYGKIPLLSDVFGAVNISVPEKPDSQSTKKVVEIINSVT